MSMSTIKRIFYGICIVAVIALLFFGYQAYDKKNNYYNSEYMVELNQNAYVGGDAYNYIINAGYFVGYSSLCGACAIVATIAFGCASLLEMTEKKKDMYSERCEELKEILDGHKAIGEDETINT